MNVLVKRTDLARNSLCTHRGFHRAAVSVTDHKRCLDTQYGRSVFETGDGCRSHKVSRYTHHEQVTDRLIKDEFDGYPGIRTGEDRSKRLLLFHRVATQYLQ